MNEKTLPFVFPIFSSGREGADKRGLDADFASSGSELEPLTIKAFLYLVFNLLSQNLARDFLAAQGL